MPSIRLTPRFGCAPRGSLPRSPGKRATPKHMLPVDLNARLQSLEKELIGAALERARFNQRVAADLLGLSYHQFRGKIRKYELDTSRPA